MHHLELETKTLGDPSGRPQASLEIGQYKSVAAISVAYLNSVGRIQRIRNRVGGA